MASSGAVGVPRDVLVDVMDMAIYAMQAFALEFASFAVAGWTDG